MAITQAQSDKDWKDYPDTTTLVMASDLKAMSRRSRDYRWMIPTGQTSVDEFDDDTLAAAWTRVDAPTGGTPTWTATASGTGGGNVADLLDTNAATYWYSPQRLSGSNDGVTGAWVQYTTTADVVIGGYSIQGASGATVAAPLNWLAQVSSDGTTWTTVDTRTNVGGWTTSFQDFTLASAVTTRRFRLLIAASGNGAEVWLGGLRINLASFHNGNVSWTEAGDALSMRHTTEADGSAELHALVRPVASSLAVGDGYVTCVTLASPPNVSYSMGGLILSDGVLHGSGNQLFAPFYAAAGITGQVGNLRSFTGYNTNVATSSSFPNLGLTTVFVRLSRTGSTSWRADYSPDGVSWLTSAAVTSSIVPTHVGFATTNWGSTTEFIHSFEFLRRVTGVS